MFQSPKPEQSVMQALESLNEQQVSFILHWYRGQTPLSLEFDIIFCSGNTATICKWGKKGTAAIMASHFQPEFVIQLLQ